MALQCRIKRRYKYKSCPHCSKELNLKKFKEHERLFFNADDKEWCREFGSDDESSVMSSIEDCNEIRDVESDKDHDGLEDIFGEDIGPIAESHLPLQKLSPESAGNNNYFSDIAI